MRVVIGIIVGLFAGIAIHAILDIGLGIEQPYRILIAQVIVTLIFFATIWKR